MPIDFTTPRPAYLQIADELRDMIDDGRLQIGDRLQSRKDLAKQYGVAPETVRRAQSVLALEGLINTQSTRGVYVIKKPEPPEPSSEYRQMMADMRRLSDQVEALENRVQQLEDR